MIRTTQWLNDNEHRAYPLTEDSVRVFTGRLSGAECALPDSVLLDFQLACYSLAPGRVSLLRFDVLAGGSVDFTFRWQADGAETADFLVTVPFAAASPYRAQARTAGFTLAAVFGDGVSALGALPVDAYDPAAAPQIEPGLLIFQDRHRVESLLGDTADSVPVAGNVYWEEGHSVRITVKPSNRSVLITPSPGSGAGYSCDKLGPDRPACDGLLLRVNGLPGDAAGNFELAGGRGFEITPLPAAHEIRVRVTVPPEEITCGGAA